MDQPDVRLEAVKLEPGDYLVYRNPRRMSAAFRAHVADQLAAAFQGHPMVILDDGASLEVIRPAEPGDGIEGDT